MNSIHPFETGTPPPEALKQSQPEAQGSAPFNPTLWIGRASTNVKAGTTKPATTRRKQPPVQPEGQRKPTEPFCICYLFFIPQPAQLGAEMLQHASNQQFRRSEQSPAKGNIAPFTWVSYRGASPGQGGKPNRLNHKNQPN